MTTQIELNLASKKPKVNEADLENALAVLYRWSSWMTSEELLGVWLLNSSESNRRWIRAVAEASNGLIISGQKGYRHIAHATPDEINHAASWLEHQAKLMANRAQAIRRQAHRLVH